MATDATHAPETGPVKPPSAPTGGGRTAGIERFAARYGVLVAMAVTFAVFSLLEPDSFFTVLTMKAILRDFAPLMIVALGITVILVMNEYDLSVGGLISLMATIVVVLLSTQYQGLPWGLAVVLTLAIGLAVGLAQGWLVAYVGLPSFILTIAMSTVFTGIGLQMTGSQSVFEGIAPGFVGLASGTIAGFSNQVFIGLAVLVVVHVVMRHTEPGRYMYAIGGNAEAAKLSGLRVPLLKAIGFGVVGLTAALAAVLLTSQAGAGNPNTGIGLLLPAYAAAFLGSSMFRVGVFTPLGTALGALFLQIIGTGLTILSLSGPLVQIIQGAILALAVLLARVVGRRQEG